MLKGIWMHGWVEVFIVSPPSPKLWTESVPCSRACCAFLSSRGARAYARVRRGGRALSRDCNVLAGLPNPYTDPLTPKGLTIEKD